MQIELIKEVKMKLMQKYPHWDEEKRNWIARKIIGY